jgi:threonine aldolase
VGAPLHALQNCERGTIPLPLLANALRMRDGGRDVHFPRPALVAIENTHNRCGGTVLPPAYMDELGALCSEHAVPVHCDGARLLNATAALGIAPSRLVKSCHSVTLCLSKGLGAPVGAVLAGSGALVERARRLRKAVGGGMRQAGIIASTGLVALDTQVKGLSEDNARARRLGAALGALPGLQPQARVDSNICFVGLDGARISVGHWEERARGAVRGAGVERGGVEPCVEDGESGVRVPVTAVPPHASTAQAFQALLSAVANVRVGGYGTTKVRLVTHHQVGTAAEEALVEGAKIVCRLLSDTAAGASTGGTSSKAAAQA